MLERAAHYDWFGQRYGWTKHETDAQPDWLTKRLPVVAAVRAEVEADKNRAAGS